jgi:tetratricopeptide (TPR) repeat protein
MILSVWWMLPTDDAINEQKLVQNDIKTTDEILEKASQNVEIQEYMESSPSHADTVSTIKEAQTQKKHTVIPQKQQTETKNEFHPENELFVQSKLPIYTRKKIPVENELVLFRKFGDELYVQDFKVVDYSKIRSENIGVNKVIHSGVPANQASRDVESLIVDGEQVKELNYLEYLEEALAMVKASRYTDALPYFTNILTHYEDDVNANFYKGLSLFYTQNFEKAIAHFEQSYTIQLGNFYEEALWFKAQSLLEINKLKAKEILERIVREGGFYAPQAMEKL